MMLADCRFWSTSRSSRKQQDGWICWFYLVRQITFCIMFVNQVREPEISSLDFDAMAILLFFQQSKQNLLADWKKFLDIRCDHIADRRLRLDRFDLVIKGSEHNHRFCTTLTKGMFKLALGVERIERHNNSASLPSAKHG